MEFGVGATVGRAVGRVFVGGSPGLAPTRASVITIIIGHVRWDGCVYRVAFIDGGEDHLRLSPLLSVRRRCSANSSSLISMSSSLFGTRVASPWYSFSLSILTTWVPRLLPSFQLGSGVILTMVSYLASSAQILHGPVQ